MKVQLTYFEGCPNSDAVRASLRRRLEAVRVSAAFEEFDIESSETPGELRTCGSPTVD